MIRYNLDQLLRDRPDQKSFHVASEECVRVEFMRFAKDQKLGPVKYDGDVVITCLQGEVQLGAAESLVTLDQAVITRGEVLEVLGLSSSAAIQIIWTPPFAMATKT